MGRVAAVASAVTRFKVGDAAGVGCMVNSCDECGFCLAGTEQYCARGDTQTHGPHRPMGENLRGVPPHQLHGRERHISTRQQYRKDRFMKCPIDGATLVISDRSGVEIDYCPECRGVWLDRGELDKIIERSAAATTRPPAPRDMRDTHDTRGGHDDYRPRKKRESFLSELFDF